MINFLSSFLKIGIGLTMVFWMAMITPFVQAVTRNVVPPNSSGVDWSINSGPNTQQKIGSLLIGNNSLDRDLCLNGSGAAECISSWKEVLGASSLANLVTLSTNLFDFSSLTTNGLDPAHYTTQSGYINLTSQVNQDRTAFIKSPSPAICNLMNKCPNGDSCSNNSDCNGTGTAVYGIAGDPGSESYAAYFGGRVYVRPSNNSNTTFGYNNEGRICLGGFDPPNNDPEDTAVAGYSRGFCISSWLQVTPTSNTYVKLNLDNPVSETQTGGASVSGSSKFGVAVLGNSAGFPHNLTCGNGYCDGSEDGASCPIDCGGMVRPSGLSVILQYGVAKMTVTTQPHNPPTGNVLVIITRAIGVPTFQPVDGTNYTSGQIIGNTKIVYVGWQSPNLTFAPPDDSLPGSGTYTYRAYQGNAFPRYSEPFLANLGPIDQLWVTVNLDGLASFIDSTGVISCFSPSAGCIGLFNRGQTIDIFLDHIAANWEVASWGGCFRVAYDQCRLTINGDVQVPIGIVELLPPPN